MTDNSLQGRVAIVTGAGLGMGEATAILFAERGARVVVADVNAEAGQATVETIRQAGGTAEFLQTDVAEEVAVAEMVAKTVEYFGRLDCAVNNAAIKPDMAMIADADLNSFDRIIAVNLRSVLACLKHEIREMLKQGRGGAIVNVSSVNGLRPQPANGAYTASKHGVIGLTKTASLEYAPHGIRVNSVLPGAIDTPMVRTAFRELNVTAEDYAPMISLFSRLGRPREVAEANLWLCSDASSYVTGHSLAVDAGYTSR
jgi:glucose 1-dehydrogenase